jgi:hypothetical protein
MSEWQPIETAPLDRLSVDRLRASPMECRAIIVAGSTVDETPIPMPMVVWRGGCSGEATHWKFFDDAPEATHARP